MSSKEWTEEELNAASAELEGKEATDALKWIADNFDNDFALACSFGAEDVVLVDLLSKVKPDARVFYIDTDKNFKETLDVRDRLVEKYPTLKFEKSSPEMTLEEMEAEHGPELWKTDAGACCGIRKVVPLKATLAKLDAWVTGIRRDQAPTRANAPIVSWDGMFNLVKVNPLVKWTSDDVWAYIKANDVPYNVLHDQNYPSIGCEPCTNKVMPGEDPRAGRWAGQEKTECGLHK